ncbi:MAG: TylF/MycF/NovP-related O-methyltransferase [Ginsengibacter sp.]
MGINHYLVNQFNNKIINTLITQDRLDAMVALAKKAPDSGYFAEVGVYKGGSLKHLALSFPERFILGFDSFEGLPSEQWSEMEVHTPGEFSDTSMEAVISFLNECNNSVRLLKGIFPGSAESVKDCKFSFIHIDTDFYLSVKACIEWFWPRLLTGGIMVFDDYGWPNCPGVQKALVEFGKPFKTTGAKYQAFMMKN